MLNFKISIEKDKDSGEYVVFCDKLELYGQHESIDLALKSFQDGVDLVASEYTQEERKVIFDLKTNTFHFKDSVAMLPFIFSQFKTTSNKSYNDLTESLGMASQGAVTKYFNAKNKTVPNVDKFLKLLNSMNCSITID